MPIPLSERLPRHCGVSWQELPCGCAGSRRPCGSHLRNPPRNFRHINHLYGVAKRFGTSCRPSPVLPNGARTLFLRPVVNFSCNNAGNVACVRLLALWASWVKTLSAILLTIAMGLPMAAPLFASTENALPACCRRDGKHHCMGKSMLQMDSGTSPAISSAQTKCPQFPKMLGVTSHGQLGLSTSTAIFAGIVSHPALSPQTLSNCRVSLLRSHQKRGPPLSFVLC